eukprot:6213364-Pleurochrysis_carterae.AAC.2
MTVNFETEVICAVCANHYELPDSREAGMLSTRAIAQPLEGFKCTAKLHGSRFGPIARSLFCQAAAARAALVHRHRQPRRAAAARDRV